MSRISLQAEIQRRAMLIAIVLMVFCIGAMSSIIFVVLYNVTVKTVNSDARETSTLVYKILEDEGHHLKNVAVELERNNTYEDRAKVLKYYLEGHSEHSAIWLCNSKGKIVLCTSSHGDIEGFDYSNHEGFISKDPDGISYSSVYVSTLSKEPVIAISHVFSDSLWVIVEFPLKNLNHSLSEIVKNQETYITVSDSKAYWIIHPDPDQLRKRETNHQFSFQREKAEQGLSSYLSFFDGVPVITSVVMTKIGSWLVAVHYSLKDVITALLVIIIFALLLGLSLVLMLKKWIKLIIQRIFNPLRKIIDASQEMGKGNYDYLVADCGYEELDQLSSSFRLMATNLKEREEKQKELLTQPNQDQKMKAIGQLAGGIAHDFNNILGGIIGFADLSLDHAYKDDMLRKYQENILKAGNRAKNLVLQILSFSRQGDEDKVPVNITPILNEVIELLKASFPSTVQFNTNIQADTIPVVADSTKIHEIIINLATNAVQSMEEKGTLTINLKEEDVGYGISGILGSIDPGRYCIIEVMDTGCGIDDDVILQIFEPFFTTKEQGKGTGLGLSVVFGVMQSHKGNIQIDSEVGNGTTFRLFFPKSRQVIVTDKSDVKNLEKGSEKILFVDDEELLVDIGREILLSLGYNVTATRSSEEALKLFKENPMQYDLLITDQTMPFLSGIELIKEVLKLRPKLPIILCTGFSSRVNKKIVEQVGIEKILYKPIRKKDLADAVRMVLAG